MSKFYLLAILNHHTRQYDLRLEDGDGRPGCRHAISNYLRLMHQQLERIAAGTNKPHWRQPFWADVLQDEPHIEQVVLAVVDAPDHATARRNIHQTRKHLKQCYRDLGYAPFRLATDTDENVPIEPLAA